VAHYHPTPIWSRRLDHTSRRLDKNPLPPLERRPPFVRASAGDAAALDDLVAGECAVAFTFSQSLSAHYLDRDSPTSGLLRYDLGSGTTGLAGWNVLPMAINDRRLRPIGQLQLVLAPGATDAQIETMVHDVALFLAERGCFAMTLLDLGVVPRGVLDHLGFVATETLIAFAARGPKTTLEAFAGLRPPFFLDFT
jgi:hypothetical protein